MKISTNGIALIKQFEGFRANAYLDSANIPTIGYGSTMWSNGRKVKMGETITITEADALLLWEVDNKTHALSNLQVQQHQFDALVSLAYNIGVGAIIKSTLFRKVRANPDDLTIRDEFMRWVRAGGKVIEGLRRRRSIEADYYFGHTV